MNRHDILLYTAGIIDGEGYISLVPFSNCNSYASVVKVCSTDKRLIDFLKLNFGGFTNKRDFDNPKWKNAYYWEIKNQKPVENFLLGIKDYLIIKKEIAELVIERCSYTIKTLHPIYKTFSQKDKDRVTEIYKKLRSLNHRGKPLAETKR